MSPPERPDSSSETEGVEDTASSGLLPALKRVVVLLEENIELGAERLARVTGFHRAVAAALDPIQEKRASPATRQFLRRLRRSLSDLDELEPAERLERLRRTRDAVHRRIRRGDRPEAEAVEGPRRRNDAPARDRSSEAVVPVDVLPGVGPVKRDGLATLGIHTVADLLHHLPRRYQDRTSATPIAELEPGEEAVVFGRVARVRAGRGRRMKFIEISVEDGTGTLLATWFRPGAWLYKLLQEGEEILLMGKVDTKSPPLRITHPEIEVGDPSGGAGLHHGVVVPMYTVPQGTGQRAMRKLLRTALDHFAVGLPDRVPGGLRSELGMLDRAEALRVLHFPDAVDDLPALREGNHPAHEALLWEDLFILQVALFRTRALRGAEGCAAVVVSREAGALEQRLKASLPFDLTGAQERVLESIRTDMSSGGTMQRMLQGDVGSGKTITALLAAAAIVEAGQQVAVLAPTEVLAWQWHDRARALYEPAGKEVALLTGGQRAAARRHNRELAATGRAGIIVGTHAVFQEGVSFSALALAVVDEQHRFGVFQRARLVEKGPQPHLLAMTATPIPRSLALTMYGDLDLAVLDERPARGEVRTELVAPEERERVWDSVRQAVRRGERAYVICSRIEGRGDGRAAVDTAEELAAGPLTGLRLGLLHGRMDSASKERALECFRSGEIEVLVGTTVVEVGVDVPEATVMVIEDAHRFGLAQLHQLRGRIGRSALGGLCFLVTNLAEETERLSVLARSHDGFEIAGEDLRLRGPGDLVGSRQSGAPAFRLSTSRSFLQLLEAARDAARGVAARDDFDQAPELAALRAAVEVRLEESVAAEAG
ncbi:MAG: ATP-dependent DNA helicase RecG [Myxococcota bacterium]|nr:ATP-dependent DNA helicase RecG [Myxococcota bacterium]